MAKEQTQKSSYPSKYSPGKFVSPLQYLVEIICERKAAHLKRGKLPIHFWRTKEWEKLYKSELRAASTLIKKYSTGAVLEAVQIKRTVYTYRAKWFEETVRSCHAKVVIRRQKIEEAAKKHVAVESGEKTFHKNTGQKNAISVLRNIDNGKEEGDKEEECSWQSLCE